MYFFIQVMLDQDQFTDKTKNDAFGDYIHASWVDGYERKSEYILAQAPFNGQTEFDFWRLVWQEWPSVILLLTPVAGPNNQLCADF